MTTLRATFNINDYVSVKLNDTGREILKKSHADFVASLPPTARLRFGKYVALAEDAEGFTRFQLWHLMGAFGPHISLGLAAPFDTEITLEVKPCA